MVRFSEESGSVKYGWTVKIVRPNHKKSTLKILVLNLMPNKIETENQFKKLFGKIEFQIELTFLRTATYESKNTPKSYLVNHYKTLTEVSLDQFDGFICTGSPVETLPFEAVAYWDELIEIFETVQKNEIPSYYICWGAQAVLNYRYGIQKVPLPEKQFGVYIYKVTQKEIFDFPTSRVVWVSRPAIDFFFSILKFLVALSGSLTKVSSYHGRLYPVVALLL